MHTAVGEAWVNLNDHNTNKIDHIITIKYGEWFCGGGSGGGGGGTHIVSHILRFVHMDVYK